MLLPCPEQMNCPRTLRSCRASHAPTHPSLLTHLPHDVATTLVLLSSMGRHSFFYLVLFLGDPKLPSQTHVITPAPLVQINHLVLTLKPARYSRAFLFC